MISYLESVPGSHYGDKAVVPGHREPGECGVPVRRLTANSGHSTDSCELRKSHNPGHTRFCDVLTGVNQDNVNLSYHGDIAFMHVIICHED